MDNHIEIDKENIRDWTYKFQSNPFPPQPMLRDHVNHGKSLKKDLHSSVANIKKARASVGVDADNLMVLEFKSEAKEPDIDILQKKFQLSVVEESKKEDGTSSLVVQFYSFEDIGLFEEERRLYESDSQVNNILTYKQRSDIFSCIGDIRSISPEDRTGPKLQESINNDSLPDGYFLVDVDIWFDSDKAKELEMQNEIENALGSSGGSLIGDLFAISNLLLGRAKVNRYSVEVLRQLDLIAKVEMPIGEISNEHCELYSSNFSPVVRNDLDDNAPLACVIDSGVYTGNPLLAKLIVGEEDFDLTENTTSDMHGHGTGVAGIVAYGDLSNYNDKNRSIKPKVRICNAKVMHNQEYTNATIYPLEKRPEQLVEEAIRYFHKEYNCRIFNLSSGDQDRVYNGGRQLAWASVLDDLSKELDIVIIVSAGNVNSPDIPNFSNRHELMEKCRNQLLSDEYRLIDPATTALGITVGAITRFEEPQVRERRPTPISTGKKDYPSVFTRTGFGVNGAIKPEFVDYGGNWALLKDLQQNCVFKKNRSLLEPTLSNSSDEIFKGWAGTSFAAPHVTHIAARIEKALQLQLGATPSANLIRALLATSAQYKQREWLDSVIPKDYKEGKKQSQDWRLRLCGFGTINDSTIFSNKNHITLFAEDKLDLRQIHLYKIPIPDDFARLKSNKRISIGFAYNPPIKPSRKSYIANSLWFEVFRRIDPNELLNYKGKKDKSEENEAERILEKMSENHGAAFKPGYTVVKNSTLQQRVWEKSSRGGHDLLCKQKGTDESYIYVLITGKENFDYPGKLVPQPYALAITYSYESESDIQLRQLITGRVKMKQRVQVRSRTQIKT